LPDRCPLQVERTTMPSTAHPGGGDPGRQLQALLDGYRSTVLLYVAARLGLSDLLADGPMSSTELACRLGAHAPSLHRILRGLVALGVCSEHADGRFGITPLGALLRADAPDSLRGAAILNGEEYLGAWGSLLESAMTGQTAFNHAFGMSQWGHREQHPELNECFNAGLTEETAHVAGAIVAAYDFSPFRTIADIGGGHGSLLAAILTAHPSGGGILFDQPHVVAEARCYLDEAGVAARCRVAGGDLFRRVPDGADIHVLKSVIHDWGDEQSLAVLRNCHRALKERGTILLVERVMPPRAADDPDTVLLDVHMLAVTGGRERTEGEYGGLFAAAGFALTRVIPTRCRFSLIEGVRV